ncbi:MAG: hypothetical protein ACYC2G_04735 [Gemmatimonadaceae bacterium]
MQTPHSRGGQARGEEAGKGAERGASVRERYVEAAVAFLLGELDSPGADEGRRVGTTRGGAGRRDVGRRSPEMLGIRLVAQLTGATHAAPLYYFPDRTCLLGAVAAEGFRRLCSELGRAPSGHATRRAAGRLPDVAHDAFRYVQWAGEHPALFTVMYDPALAADLELLQRAMLSAASPVEAFARRHGGNARAVERRVEAFEELLTAKAATLALFTDRVSAAIAAGVLRDDQPVERVTYALTSLADGLAWQRITEPQASPGLLDEHARSCLGLLLEGIADGG